MFPGLSPIGIVRLIVAILISAGAVLAGLLFFLSFRRRNNPLLYFALGAGMYGARLFLITNNPDGGIGNALISLLIPAPLLLFFVWKRLLRPGSPQRGGSSAQT